ncbi:cytochrome P450 [Mycena vulgaris]|nr:cytochrome P450 [Mycena vulgaris]
MDDPKLLIYGALALVAIGSVRKVLHDSKLDAIPVVGSSGFFSSYREALKFLSHARELIQQGYDQHPDGIFRVARLFHWDYIVCGPKLVNEVGGAPEHILSFYGGVEELTMGRAIAENPYHQNTIRTSLTRNLHRCFPDVRDEIVCAFDEVLQLQGSEWKALPVLPVTMAIVARVRNRLFVGLPLCRDKAYLQNNIQYTIDVIRSAGRISLWPSFLRPINDLTSWLLEIAEGEERTAPALALRILATKMAAIHTSSMAFTHALFDLSVHAEHFLPMREEAERVVKGEGWTKAALNNMVKIDSFLRESQRLNGNGPVSMTRKVVAKDGFRFSDGTLLPYGSFVSVAGRPAHYDPGILFFNYARLGELQNAATFDGFRFAREREEQKLDQNPSKDIFKRHMVSTAVDHLPFGTGKHACPGRFFAATELKAMLAHLVLNYDIKAEVEGARPPDNNFGPITTPSATGRVCFRKRQ